MIFDVHAHSGPWFFPMGPHGVQHNVAMMTQAGITIQVISHSLAVTYDFREGNRVLATEIRPHHQLYGYIVLNPHYLEESREELSTWADSPLFVGVKIHPSYVDCELDGPPMDRLWGMLSRAGMPVLLHTWGDEVTALAAILRRHPELRVIAAHMAGPSWPLAVEMACTTPRLYLEPCCSVTDRGKLEMAVERLPPDRLLFGTDATLIKPSVALGMVEEGVPDPEHRQRVLWDNAVGLFGISESRGVES